MTIPLISTNRGASRAIPTFGGRRRMKIGVIRTPPPTPNPEMTKAPRKVKVISRMIAEGPCGPNGLRREVIKFSTEPLRKKC